MKLTDKIGNELQRADLVTFSAEELVGVISEIDSGEIARPLSVQGGVTADARLPVIIIKVQFQTGFAAGPDGVFSKLLKVCKPNSDVNNLIQ